MKTNCCNVYLKLRDNFSSMVNTNEFIFDNVIVKSCSNYLTIYDDDASIRFRCCISDIDKFCKCDK